LPSAAPEARRGRRHTLRGADLWHLAQVRTLLGELPGLKMLTFDRRLRVAAASEGLLPGE
jgi:hypothetical protein